MTNGVIMFPPGLTDCLTKPQYPFKQKLLLSCWLGSDTYSRHP